MASPEAMDVGISVVSEDQLLGPSEPSDLEVDGSAERLLLSPPREDSVLSEQDSSMVRSSSETRNSTQDGSHPIMESSVECGSALLKRNSAPQNLSSASRSSLSDGFTLVQGGSNRRSSSSKQEKSGVASSCHTSTPIPSSFPSKAARKRYNQKMRLRGTPETVVHLGPAFVLKEQKSGAASGPKGVQSDKKSTTGPKPFGQGARPKTSGGPRSYASTVAPGTSKGTKRAAPTAPAVPAKRGRACPLCPLTGPEHTFRHHMMLRHLLWFLNPLQVCWKCRIYVSEDMDTHLRHHQKSGQTYKQVTMTWGRLVYGALHFLAHILKCDSLEQLFVLIHEEALYTTESVSASDWFSEAEQQQMKSVEFILAKKTPLRPMWYRCSPPNRVLALIHWEVLAQILTLLSPAHREAFRMWHQPMNLSGTLFAEPLPEATEEPSAIEFVDSHMHLDLLLQRTIAASLDQLAQRFHRDDWSVTKMVANYVFRDHWDHIKSHHDGDTQGRVALTVGIHPKAMLSSPSLSVLAHRLRSLLVQDKVVGLGEIEYDLSQACDCGTNGGPQCNCDYFRCSAQDHFLHLVLPWVQELKKVLVLHCRDHDNGDRASVRMLHFLKTNGYQHLPIHRHGFIGSTDEISQWIEVFPKVMFGITAKSINKEWQCRSVRQIPEDRFLLESDSPVLPVYGKSGLGTSWSYFDTAKEIANIRDVKLSDLVRTCNANTA